MARVTPLALYTRDREGRGISRQTADGVRVEAVLSDERDFPVQETGLLVGGYGRGAMLEDRLTLGNSGGLVFGADGLPVGLFNSETYGLDGEDGRVAVFREGPELRARLETYAEVVQGEAAP